MPVSSNEGMGEMLITDWLDVLSSQQEIHGGEPCDIPEY